MKKGYFGAFGGQFVPELLMPPLIELEEAMERILPSQEFQDWPEPLPFLLRGDRSGPGAGALGAEIQQGGSTLQEMHRLLFRSGRRQMAPSIAERVRGDIQDSQEDGSFEIHVSEGDPPMHPFKPE